MERGINLNDPRLKQYLDSLDPKYRKMLEDIYGKHSHPQSANNTAPNSDNGQGG